MRTPARITVLLLLCGNGCAQATPDYSPRGGGGSISTTTTSDAGAATDAGVLSDAGSAVLPMTECPGDLDGVTSGQTVVISELNFATPQFVELYNRSSSAVALGTLELHGSLEGQMLQGAVAANAHAVVGLSLPASAGEVGVSAGGTPIFYVCWGAFSPTLLEAEAQQLGIWTGSCALSPGLGTSIHLRGSGTNAADWRQGRPSPDGCPLP